MTSITIKEYYAERGSLYSNKDAAVIGPVLVELSEHGDVTARDVLDAARSSNSPLNSYFEWRDDVAADLYRTEQARNILRSIRVKFIDGQGEARQSRIAQITTKRAYGNEPSQYRSFKVLDGDSAFAAQMMDSAFDDIMSWKRKYAPYVEMWARFGDCFQGVLNQVSEFEEGYRAEHIAEQTDVAVSELIEWRDKGRAVLETWTVCREQVGFIMDAIGEAEKAFTKHVDAIVEGKATRPVDSDEAPSRAAEMLRIMEAATPAIAKIADEMPFRQKRILAILKAEAEPDGLVAMQKDDIAAAAECSRAAIPMMLEALDRAGHIHLVTPAQGIRPAVYRISGLGEPSPRLADDDFSKVFGEVVDGAAA